LFQDPPRRTRFSISPNKFSQSEDQKSTFFRLASLGQAKKERKEEKHKE